MNINRFLDNPKTHWQAYKNLFQITVFRYLVTWFAIVPFLANILVNLPPVLKVDFLHTKIEYVFNMDLPFSWKLLWIASLSFVIAYSLYLIFCPAFVRKYNSYKDYIAMMHSPRWIIWESKNIFSKKMDIDKFHKRISTKKYIEHISKETFDNIRDNYNQNKKNSAKEFKTFGAIIEEKQTKLYFEYNNDYMGLGLPVINNSKIDNEATEVVEKELFWEVFGRYSAASPIMRLSILILLLISAILFVIVFAQNIITGFQFLLN